MIELYIHKVSNELTGASGRCSPPAQQNCVLWSVGQELFVIGLKMSRVTFYFFNRQYPKLVSLTEPDTNVAIFFLFFCFSFFFFFFFFLVGFLS